MARQFRERMEFNALNNNELQERYRLNHAALQYLDDMLAEVLTPRTRRNHSLPSIYKVLVTLRYLATGTIQLNMGDLHRISQSSVSRVVEETLEALTSPQILGRYITFPMTMDKLNENKEAFYSIARFPNVIGVIDGTHVQIKAPTTDEPMFVNRMGYHSINTQIVFDHSDKIIDVVARWPGATHDSRMLRESGLWQIMEGQHLPAGDHYLLGDSGYPCKRWLLTPYMNPRNNSQEHYNRSHKVTRSKVERGIGQLKRRWGILNGEIKLSPKKTCQVILACCVLHNICKDFNIPVLDVVQDNADNGGNQNPQMPGDGLRYRDLICARYF